MAVQDDYHVPVLTSQVLRYLQPETAACIADLTLGDGGHSQALMQAMPPHGRVIAFDLDAEAIARARERLHQFGERFIAVQANFSHLQAVLEEQGMTRVDGVLADLGVSRRQISEPAKGFMFNAGGPLRMQMDPRNPLDAEQVINEYDEATLADIMWQYGEERFSRRIAAVLVRMRKSRRLQRTDDLADAVRQVVKGPMVVKSLARVFQAFRIFIVGELDNLQTMLPQAVAALRPGRRGVIISYHSLEDRITKRFIREASRPCICPPRLPVCVCQRKPVVRPVDDLIMADEAEQELNRSSRSARLRIFEKI